MVWTLDGPFATANYAYRLTSPQVAFDNTGFVDVRAEGRGRFTPWPMRVPMRLTARRTTGVGDVAGGILANLRLEGMLSITPQLVRGDGLVLTSDKLKGKVSLLIDLAHRAVRHSRFGRPDALFDPGAGDRRRDDRAARRSVGHRQGQPGDRHRQGVGAAARQ